MFIQIKGGFGRRLPLRRWVRVDGFRGGSQSSRRTPLSQSWHRRLVSLVERRVRLEPPREGEGRTNDGSTRRSVHARESLWAITPASAVFKQVPHTSLAPRGTEVRRRIRVVSTRSRGGMSSGRGRPEIGRGRELTKAGSRRDIYLGISWRGCSCRLRRLRIQPPGANPGGGRPPSSTQDDDGSGLSWLRKRPILGC